MGQRTRQGRARTNGKPISRGAYRGFAAWRAAMAAKKELQELLAGRLPLDNASGRARFAAKHAGLLR